MHSAIVVMAAEARDAANWLGMTVTAVYSHSSLQSLQISP